MSSNLSRFQSDGIDIYINTLTGESFTSRNGYARMSGKDKSTISERLKNIGSKGGGDTSVKNVETLTDQGSKGGGDTSVKNVETVEVDTAGGKQTIQLINEDLLAEWLPKDNPALATKLLKLTTRIFLHELAGYKVTVSSTAVISKIEPTQDEIETYEANLKEIANLQRAISRMELKSQFNLTFSYVVEWKCRNYEWFRFNGLYKFDNYEACLVNEIYTKVLGDCKRELVKKMNLTTENYVNIRDHIPLHALEALRTFEKYFKQLIVVMGIKPHDAIELAIKSIQTDCDWCNIKFPIEFDRAKAITCPSTFSEEDWLTHWQHELSDRKESVKLFLIKFDDYETKSLKSE